ncbi:MAG: TIGR02569 family protein [Actinobacteria bacterium]|nr:TIGR02569 family protein [Actinomycetota bacterium]
MLDAFGCDGALKRAVGGEGRTWRCGDVAFKPADDPEQATWVATVLSTAVFRDVVVPSPRRSRDGRWVVAGWAATQWVDARHERGRWEQVIAAGRAFHRALTEVRRPSWMDRATDWWRRADQVAWGGREPTGHPDLVALVDRLLRLREPIDLDEQLVHGDLCGNVLFCGRDLPVVIDFSPYWRPVEWASAVVVVDAFEWEGAGPQALEWLRRVPEAHQLLLRAAIYRIATSAEVAMTQGLDERKLGVHRRTVEALESRA